MSATYAEFLNNLGKLVTFEGENPGDASVGTLTAVIGLAESRIYREVRSGYNEVAFSGTTTANVFTLPAAFRSASTVHMGGRPLEPVSAEFIQDFNDANNTGDCRYFAVIGRTFVFGPAVADSTAVQGTYFGALAALSESTFAANTLMAAAEDLFTFACMVEAAPLYGFMDQLPLWNAKYMQVKDQLNLDRQRAAYSAGRIKRRPSTTLMG